MQTSDAIQMFEQINQILKLVPEEQLTDAFDYILKAVKQYVSEREHQPKAPQKRKVTTLDFKVAPCDLELLSEMDTMKLRSFLKSSDYFTHKMKLQALVQQIGIPFTKKQTKEDLLNLIVQHYQMHRMDSMIKTHQTHLEPIEIKIGSE
ncbi:hypothetical protein CIG75_14195 [Tumebacillus algifaecis]|uniref:Uncharacterized protein n=1 Tax=Tumebacillus algifaecis TaxID=1214604 RepID=A0A223D358_9BACL|nr:hypothetical protein [Tumebacillus algifaecis]ASS76000.1 hypothetical protein CIG75_14195 [Tumebacillus algifaecis]